MLIHCIISDACSDECDAKSRGDVSTRIDTHLLSLHLWPLLDFALHYALSSSEIMKTTIECTHNAVNEELLIRTDKFYNQGHS